MHDITEDVAKLLALADWAERNEHTRAVLLSPDEAVASPDDLRRIAAHLERIATGGHRPVPEGLTAEPMPYEAEPPA